MAVEESAFFRSVRAHFEQIPDENVLSSIRQKAWERLILIGLPSKKNEAFRNVSLRDLYATTFEYEKEEHASCPANIAEEINKALLPESRHSHIVFVNGMF